MSCPSYRGALLDVALGTPASPGLLAHLGSCSACREALERERGHVSRIDRELRSALEAEPSPGFLPHARRRAAEKERPPAWLSLPWLVPAGIGLAVLMGGILVGRRSTPPPVAQEPAIIRPTPAPPRESPAPDVAAAAPAPGRRPIAPQPARSEPIRPPPREPEVLLPAGEEAAFQRFVQDMQERRVDRISLLAAGLETGDVESIAVAAVEVEPLAIEPLSRSDR